MSMAKHKHHRIITYNISIWKCIVVMMSFVFVVKAQSPYASSKQNILLSNAQSGASERWISFFAPSALAANYRLVFPSTAPVANQLLQVASIVGVEANLQWVNASDFGNSAWSLTGNASTTSSNFLGTTDAQPLQLRTNNTARLHFTSSGLLGIGTTNPQSDVHIIDKGAGNYGLRIERFNSVQGPRLTFFHARGTESSPTAIQNGDIMGQLLFAGYDGSSYSTTNPSGIKFVATENYTSTAQGAKMEFYTTPNGSTSAALRMTIDQDGDVGIGTASLTQKFTVFNGSTTGTYTSSGWSHSSDSSLKTNVTPITDALTKVRAINGVFFNWKKAPNSDRQVGYIAQQIKQVLPEVVTVNESGIHSVAYGSVTALHNEAIKELQQRVELLSSPSKSISKQIFSNIGDVVVVVKKLDEQTTSNNNEDDELTHIINAGETWEFECTLHYSAQTAESSVNMQLPMGSEFKGSVLLENSQDRFFFATDLKHPINLTTTSATIVDGIVKIRGVVKGATNAEAIRLRYSANQDVVVKSGSFIKCTRLQ